MDPRIDLRGFIYLPHHLIKAPYRELLRDVHHVCATSGSSWPSLLWDMLSCSVRYKASLEDYFELRFYRLPPAERAQYACTGAVYEFRRPLNSAHHRKYFRSKALFHQAFHEYTCRDYLYLRTATPDQFSDWVGRFPVFIAKPNYGMQGTGLTRFRSSDWPQANVLWRELCRKRLDLLEEPIAQHPRLQELNPTCVNTVRVVTVLWQGRVDVIGTILRMGVGGVADNFSAGGIGAPIDAQTGLVTGPAVGRDIRSDYYESHPLTGCDIVGFRVPHWPEILELAREAASVVPQVATVGWDIAVTPQGPVLVEGNDDWGKFVWQVPQGQGCLSVLQRYK